MSMYLGDICIFKRRPYAINRIGKTITVGLDDLNAWLVAEPPESDSEPLLGGNKKFLVESEGKLLLVVIYEFLGFASGDSVFWIKVFRLDEKARKWVKLTSLGDRVLFLGNGCLFSASASELSVTKGNCVIFIDDAFLHFNCKNMQYGNCVFDLDQRQLTPLSDCPEYFNLFWPPTEWIGECCVPK
ncbi:hypothetical protein MtrunA17_Chr1g0151701 [Medicago truncatula]|uniref:F-box protein n=1 Tax=Medicago truncatula TaxID=3880 RepID=G7IB95_MEDTR|nr:F-box protein SKIP23 [Medicago truncatula]AES59279.1 F-box protein [Medicago truncatula]RHN77154.1 hypothetical protein MtrunA17_Chr1g0151701 [Medicago truncatula]